MNCARRERRPRVQQRKRGDRVKRERERERTLHRELLELQFVTA